MRALIRASLFLVALLTVNVYASAKKIPVSDFFKNASHSSFQLSPNGKYMALLSPVDGRRNILVVDTHNMANSKVLTGIKRRDIAGYFWANDDTIVFTMDDDGNEAFSLYKVDVHVDKPKIVPLVISAPHKTVSVLSTLPDDNDHILVQFNGERTTAPDVYKLALDSRWSEKRRNRNVKNGGMQVVAKNPGNVQGWIVDNDGDVRGAYSIEGLRGQFHYKEKNDEDFKLVREFDIEAEGIQPLAFDYDNKTMFVASNIGRDTQAIYKYDPVTDKLGDLVFEHPKVDVTNLLRSRHQQKVLGVAYTYEYPEVVWFDKATKSLMEGLESSFPGKRVAITSQSRDESLAVVTVSSDTDPGTVYLLDRKTNKLSYLIKPRDWLKEQDMSPMKPFKYTSRDGMTIHGYITIPKNSEGKNLPLIVNPHGGPFGVRDNWGFNPEHQFFANRGYATVQVNYRGSGGYGRNFQQAGYGGKWGNEMQHDITDAVNHLVKEGIVDPKKVCIYGASYGGYATMAGLTFTPDVYACGINYVGVTDVALLFEDYPKAWKPIMELMAQRIGDPKDKELMKKISPLHHVDKIRAPLMIVHGAKDPRVVKEHALNLKEAMESNGTKFTDDEWVYKENEGHGFRNEENRLELYEKMEKFLAKHLK